MYKSFLILVLLVLFGSYTQVAAQATSDKSRPQTNTKNPTHPINSVPTVMAASKEPNAEAKELYREGMTFTEAGQFSQAVENLQQALRLDPEYADAYAALGRAYFKMREWQKALVNLRRAAELNTRQRASQDALSRMVLTQESKEARTQLQSSPISPQIKLSQGTDANAAAVKSPTPESETIGQPEHREEASIPTTATTTSPQTTLPQETNGNAAGVKPPNPESETIGQPEHREEASIPTTATTASPQTTLPQETNGNAAGVKPPNPEPETTRQPEYREEASIPTTATTASPQTTLPQGTNGNAAGVKPPNPESETTRQPEQREEASIPTAATTASPQTTLPQGTDANAAAVKSPSPKAGTTRQPEQPEEASIPTTATTASPQTTLPQGTDANAAGVKQPSPELETTRQPEPTADTQPEADTEPALKSDDHAASEKEEPVGAPVSMTVKPTPAPLEIPSASPVSTKTSSDEKLLTRIYRIGPSDVLDVRMNDSQSPQSTLFTVTSSGLLEHPMLPEPLVVTGFTAEEIGARIESELSKRALLDNPKVAVRVRDYASHTIFVSGLVKDSGTKFLTREAIPLYVVVADAQPLPEAARVTLVRTELNQIYEIDLTQAADMNLLVRPGDVITLLPNVTRFIYIGGEVKFPGEKTFRPGLTLTQAMITAGGVTPKSKVAEVARDDGRGFLVLTHFNLNDIQSGKAVDPLLMPGDRIMVVR